MVRKVSLKRKVEIYFCHEFLFLRLWRSFKKFMDEIACFLIRISKPAKSLAGFSLILLNFIRILKLDIKSLLHFFDGS